MEFILGEDKTMTDFARIASALDIMAVNNQLVSLVAPKNNFNASAGPALSNQVSAFALYALHCLVNKPELIIIDNAWLDSGYEEIVRVLGVLDQALPQATIIAFARNDNDYLNYQQKYEIASEITKIS